MITNTDVTNYSLTEVLVALRNSTEGVTTALLDAVNKLIELFHSDESYGLFPILNSDQGLQVGEMISDDEFDALSPDEAVAYVEVVGCNDPEWGGHDGNFWLKEPYTVRVFVGDRNGNDALIYSGESMSEYVDDIVDDLQTNQQALIVGIERALTVLSQGGCA